MSNIWFLLLISQLLLSTKCTLTKTVTKSRFRLSNHLIPVVYDLKLTMNSFTENIDGQVKIELQCTEPTSLIQLHANPQFITVHHSLLEHRLGNETFEMPRPVIEVDNQTINYFLDFVLEDSHVYYLNIWFSTRYSSESKGLTQMQDPDNGIWINSLFEPSHARELLPCFDEPHLRASFKLELWLKNDFSAPEYVALSNTNGSKKSWNTDLAIWTFDATLPLPTYLFTVAVGKFRSFCEYKENVKTEICIWRFSSWESWEQTGTVIIETMSRYQEAMLRYLDVDPSSRLHLLVIPSKLNGMENAGLLNIKEALWPNENDTISFHVFCKTLFHEMAHQWFGNLVTMNWWNDIWLSESLTTFMSIQRTIPFDPLTDLSTEPLVSDAWIANIPHISYTKGPAILQMLEGVIGQKKMKTILRTYIKNHQFRAAETANFLKILGSETLDLSFDAVDFLTSWLYQGSHPLVFVDFDAGMKRFVFSQTPKMGDPAVRWPIPIWIDCVAGSVNETLFWIPREKQLVVNLEQVTTMLSQHAVGFNRKHPVYYQISYRFKKRKAVK